MIIVIYLYTLIFLTHFDIANIEQTEIFPQKLDLIRFLKFNPIMHLGSVCLGFMAGNLKNSLPKMTNTILFVLSFSVFFITQTVFRFPIFDQSSIFFITWVFFLAYDESFISKILSNRLFRYLGELSLGMFLLHLPAYYIYSNILGKTNFKLFLVLFFGICILSNYFIEKKLTKVLLDIYFKKFSKKAIK